jgi:chromosome partitioning protein
VELVGIAEIAQLLGVSKQVVANWRARKRTFPAPAAELKSGPVWEIDSIKAWAQDEGIELAENDLPQPSVGTESTMRRAVVAAMMNMKGGVGKSTMTANVGWFAAYTGNKRVLLIDLDPQFNLSQYILGVRGYEKLLDDKSPTVETVFAPSNGSEAIGSELIQEVRNWEDNSCIHLIPANLELAWSMKYLTDRAHLLHDYLEEVKNQYDLILIDCAPTESILSTAAYLAADYVFVPVKPEFLSTIGLPLLLRSMEEFRKTHRNHSAPELGGIIFNDTGEKLEHDRSREYVKNLAQKHKLTVFKHEVSHSDSYPAGARVGKPIFLTDNARTWKKDEFNRVAKEFIEKVGL